MPCNVSGVANSSNAAFVDVLARWLFARETPDANPAFMRVVKMWGVRAPTYNDEFLVRDYLYEPVVACLGPYY